MKILQLFEEWVWNRKKKYEPIKKITNNQENEIDVYDDYETDNPFNTLGTFLNNKLQVDLDYEMGEYQSASDYLDDEVGKILKLDILQDDKIKKMIDIITKFEIRLPPYKWTESKKEKLRDKLEDMFEKF